GMAPATIFAASFSRASVFDPYITNDGTFTEAKRERGTLNSRMTPASYGNVCATATSLRQIHGSSGMIKSTNDGTPTISFMKYFTAPPRLPSPSSCFSRASCAAPWRSPASSTYGGASHTNALLEHTAAP